VEELHLGGQGPISGYWRRKKEEEEERGGEGGGGGEEKDDDDDDDDDMVWLPAVYVESTNDCKHY
jgi:hypothetical protein